MARNREERYADAARLIDDLERYLADEPVGAYRARWWERVSRWARHHRTTVASAAVALVLIVAGGVGGLFLWQKTEHLREQQSAKYLDELQRSAADAEVSAL